MTNLVLKLAENARSVGVRTAYGDPIQVEGVTLVPVALVQYGFGGGDAGESDGGAGGGGGGLSIPIGAYVKSGNTVRFDPNVVSLLVVAIPFVWVAGRAVSHIIRAVKR